MREQRFRSQNVRTLTPDPVNLPLACVIYCAYNRAALITPVRVL